MKRRSRRAHTIGSSETLKSDGNTFSFDENFVVVLTKPPRLQVQVLDDEQAPTSQRKYVTIKKLALTLAVLYKGLLLLLKTKSGYS